MTIIRSNSANPPIVHPLADQKIPSILEETTAEKISDLALKTLQQSPSDLSLVLQKQDQLSTELKILSLKLELILQKLDTLSKENKQPVISLCPPPPPPPPPPPKIKLKDQEELNPSNSTNCVGKSEMPNNSLGTVVNGEMKDHIERMKQKWASNKISTVKTGTNLHRSKSLCIRNRKKEETEMKEAIQEKDKEQSAALSSRIHSDQRNEVSVEQKESTPSNAMLPNRPVPAEHVKQQDENDKKPETEESISVAAIREKFKNLSQKSS